VAASRIFPEDPARTREHSVKGGLLLKYFVFLPFLLPRLSLFQVKSRKEDKV
jgi:hypothetical protein